MMRWRRVSGTADADSWASDQSPATSDADLVRAAWRSDKRAFVEIVARHQAMVCGIALGVLGDFAASEDAGQEAFLIAWRKIHELREPERLRAWLGQIARHAALGHLRRQRGHDPLDHAPVLADESPAPDEAAAKEEEAALVRESLAKLPETYRLPLILYYREGQSVRSVAETLAISEDAVKQRLARGREMLRDRMSGLIETVLTRTRPTAVFTMAIAAAIGALAAPTAVAGSVFTAASVASGATSTSAAASTTALTAMSTSKTILITAALVAAASVPVGYHVGTSQPPSTATPLASPADVGDLTPRAAPSFENSALFAEWRQLHDTHGRSGESMPALYRAIAGLKDPFRRRAFRAALIAEWAQVDPAGGLAFVLSRGPDASQRRQFFEEWLALDARAAVDVLMTSRPGWETMARDCLPEIARRMPSRVADIVACLPKPDSYWNTKVREAFAILADGGLGPARSAAEAMTDPNREQALAGVAQAWAKSDLHGAIAWAKALAEGTDRDEVIRAALLGRAAVDPATALDLVGLVPSGGREGYFATTTGARVLAEAAKANFDATVAWIAAHPGRLGRDDMHGLAKAVTERLNADATGFLKRRTEDGSLASLLPAIDSAILNDAAGQRAAIWDWLKTQPNTAATKSLKDEVLRSAAWQHPELALRLVADLPRTPEGDSQLQELARCLFNGGDRLHRYDKLLAQAPERLRQPLVEAAFNSLGAEAMHHPQLWIDRLAQLPEASRARGTESIARAWAEQMPEEATPWVASLSPGDTRNGAAAAVASTWARQDVQGAAAWVTSLVPGAERDRCAHSLVVALGDTNPREAWEWALRIGDTAERIRAATHAAQKMAARDPATARQWIDAGPFTAETKAELQAALERRSRSPGPR